MEFRRHEIPDVIEIVPHRFADERGYFSEVFRADLLAGQGVKIDWVQDNQSLSVTPGTIRGLHLQAPPMAQDKLIRVLTGAVYDVAVDIRKGSPSYGQWVGVTLSAKTGNQLLVPKGFAHGFMTLEPDTQVLYKISAPYARETEMAIRWDDPHLAIDWPMKTGVTLSGKDEIAPWFRDHEPVFNYEGRA